MNTELAQSLFDGLKVSIGTYAGQQMNNLDFSISEDGTPSQLVDAYLQADFDDDSDSKMKKIMVAAQLIGHATGAAPIEKVSDIGLAANADQTVEHAKALFKVATDQISLEEAADRMIDVAATRLMASTDVLVDHEIDLVSTKLVPAISEVYPPAAPIAIATSLLLQKAKPLIKTVVNKSIPVIKEKAKLLSRSLIDAGRKAISKLFA
jgi:hypothetical protein